MVNDLFSGSFILVYFRPKTIDWIAFEAKYILGLQS